jgi:hypothetical protein
MRAWQTGYELDAGCTIDPALFLMAGLIVVELKADLRFMQLGG